MELNKRKDVPVELTWDLSLIYPTEEAMLRLRGAGAEIYRTDNQGNIHVTVHGGTD